MHACRRAFLTRVFVFDVCVDEKGVGERFVCSFHSSDRGPHVHVYRRCRCIRGTRVSEVHVYQRCIRGARVSELHVYQRCACTCVRDTRV